jgi:hypothetical protein
VVRGEPASEKQLFREAFQVPHLPRHSNLQLGDSGIAKRFGGLTPEGAKSPIKLYNRLCEKLNRRLRREPVPPLVAAVEMRGCPAGSARTSRVRRRTRQCAEHEVEARAHAH